MYRISAQAILDLEDIWMYTFENWSINQADRYYELIIAEIEYVTENFENGRSITQIRAGYKSSKVNSHIIFYRKEQDRIIEIVRILHDRMDLKGHLDK